MPQIVEIDLLALVHAYEAARRAAGIGSREWRVTPRQMLDVHRVIAGLAWGDGADLERYVAYLAPILAESGAAKLLLHETLVELASKAPLGGNGQGVEGGKRNPDPPTGRSPSERIGAWLREHGRRAAAVVFVMAALVCAVSFPWRIFSPDPPVGGSSDPPASNHVGPRRLPATDAAERAVRAYESALATALDALRDQRFVASGGLTPRRLAAVHVGRDPRLGSPDALLAAMLRGWPMPPDARIGADRQGQTALKRLSAEVAVVQSGLPRVLFEPAIAREEKGSLLEAGSNSQPNSSSSARVRPWSQGWLALAGLPFAVYLVFAAATYRRRVRALVRRWWRILGPERRRSVLTGISRSSGPVPVWLPLPRINRTSIRGLTRYHPAPGRRFDAPRSIDALLRAAGFADPVMRNIQRAVHYLVVIQRIQPHDHERLRVRAFFERLGEMGIPVSVYDYDHTPLAVRRAVAAEAGARAVGVNGRDELLTLPALRDLHPEARLVLVTDGRDLFDLSSGGILAPIVNGLGFWKERMILTPVPVGNWGEIEYALALDFDAPLGRTGQDALADLCRGFGADGRRGHRIALERARLVSGAMERLDAWRQAAAEGFGPTALRTARGRALTFEHGMLATDIAPDAETIATIRDELWLWLGQDGFLWHAACAVYPQLRYDLTLHIGQNLRARDEPEAPVLYRDTPRDRLVFERMTGLPWFRTGRMPEWLRRDLLAAIKPADLLRATSLVRAVFSSTGLEGQGPLAIWWPRTGALTMPPDAVMADAFSGELGPAPPAEPDERIDALERAARLRVFLRQAGTASIVALACAAAAWFIPDFEASPHPAGAWFPLIVYLSGCLASVGVWLSSRRADRSKPPSVKGSQTAGIESSNKHAKVPA